MAVNQISPERRHELAQITAAFDNDRGRLLDILWAAQKKAGFVTAEEIHVLAENLHCSPADLTEVQSFYHFFRCKPSGRHQIYLDNSVISEFAGMPEVRRAFEKELGVKVGGVSVDGSVGLFETSCIGMSDQAPAALIDLVPYPRLTPQDVPRLIQELRSGTLKPRPVESHWPLRGNFFTTNRQAGQGLTRSARVEPQAVFDMIKKSGLRGRGGAGFPTGLKWQSTAQTPGSQRYVVCNADEGEPGTFKDRELITQFCDLVWEGMAIAARAIGANEVIFYLRAEYFYLLKVVEQSLERMKSHAEWKGLKGRIQLGAGAYVCGEETALLESLEGKRGEPRLRPPFPVEKGYRHCPTTVNNVETFALAAIIMAEGPEPFAAMGTEKSKGPRLLSIAGDVKKPGIFEVPWGIKLGEVLDLCQAIDPHIVQVGGPSGACVSAADRDRRICFEDLATGGSFMVFSKSRSLFEILDNFMDFFVAESCGNCTPCRAGNIFIGDSIKKLRQGKARAGDLKKLQDWCQIVMKSSRCGLGASSPNVVTTSLKAFPEIYKKALREPQNPLIFDFDVATAVKKYDEAVRSSYE
ncbi:MAG: NADP oxidoreductase [Bdellovibrio sp.]|nr:MAG: NADP oxidoreductase [Bdellovibrio sp.]